MRKITTTTSGFFSATGRVLQHAFDPKQFLRDGLCIGGVICVAQFLHSAATLIGGSLGYLTSCLVGSKNNDTTNAIVGWIVLAALLVQMLKMAQNKLVYPQSNVQLESKMGDVLPGLAGVFATSKKSDSMEELAEQLMQDTKTNAGLKRLAEELITEMNNGSP